MAEARTFVPSVKKEVILASLAKGERLDGRKADQYREIRLEKGIIGKADGSARVFLGSTQVIAGVKLAIGTPFPDAPNEGVQIVNAELSPVASPFFEPGPPGEEDIELARVVDRGFRSAKVVDLAKLSIIPSAKCWTLYIDIYPLDHDGNLVDAAGLAALLALLDTKLPRTSVQENKIAVLDEKDPLPINTLVVYVTVAKIGEYLVVDPTLEEELTADAKITFGITERGEICAIQKSGEGSFRPDEVLRARDMALKASSTLFEAIKKAVEQKQ
ncbi:exosome complex protein Rrp42 [Thermofilum pendens]|uniref:Exosome complex component Rrp42 n=1 Tax=Thermofilum pendens (strain DSM 2475 / Hrk 5) TaxID=368408 RepID=A1RXQ5_THEPD|nr:exosome complex protein Rrp42 [Thermofilum pendens]ABL77985.1 ribosomal RNA-processing protein RRP42 [Thermofilum pendens Hrk 5]